MDKIQICNASGKVELRDLSKSQPVTIGQHATSDIVIDEDNVATLHGRISWSGSAFELTAASKDGIEVNGTFVKHWVLSNYDVIRIGSFDITFLSDDSSIRRKKQSSKNAKSPAKGTSALSQNEVDGPLDLDDVYDDLEQIDRRRQRKDVGEEDAELSGLKTPIRGGRAPYRPDDDFAGSPPTSELSMAELIEEETQDATPEPDEDRFEKDDVEPPSQVSELPASHIRRLLAQKERPGEQNLLRSPLVLFLGGGGGLLLITTLVFWFLIDREHIKRQFEAAENDLKQGQFSLGIQRFEEFVLMHPRDKLAKGPNGAHVKIGKAKVEKELVGTPAWGAGLKALQQFVTENRDESYFSELHADIAQFAKQIAIGAPKTAALSKQRSLLELSIEAEALLDRYSPVDAPPTEAKKAIAKARSDAEAAILKAGVLEKALAEIDAALKNNDPFAAVVTRHKLIVRYPDLKTDKKVSTELTKALDLAKSLVVREEFSRDAETDDSLSKLPNPLTLAVRTRSLSDEQSANRVVFALGQDSCFAMDNITGDPVWRRPIGISSPFFPIPIETSRSAVLVFDTTQNQLVLLDRRDGELIWRQAVGPVAGSPLVAHGQIYLATLEGFLYRIDADSGRITSRLKFPQRLLTPPIAMADEVHLLVFGDAEFAYTLGLSPMECKLVSPSGHQAGTIEAAPLAMGQYVLLAENDRATSSRLRVLNASKADQRLTDVAEQRVDGHIRDELILRGNELFVASAGPRLTVFSVSDDKNQKTLAQIATTQIPTSHSGAAHLAAGTDGQVWLSVGALRKVVLKTDVLQLDQQAIAIGQSTQPLQMIGRNLYVGRQLPIGAAVHFTQADGESMQSNWRTVVGARLLAVNQGLDGQLVVVTESADTFLLSTNEVTKGGFRARSEQQLKLPENTLDPLQATALAEGRIAVWTNGADGKLWVVGPSALPQAEVALPQPLECAPLRFAGGVLLPIPGRLKLGGRTGGPACDDFLAPVNTKDDGTVRKWKHLVAIDDDKLFAFDSTGKMLKLQYRTGDKTFFQTISSVDFLQPIDVVPTIHNGRLLTADAAGKLRVLDVTAMETRAEIDLGGPASKPIWVAEPLMLVEVARQRLIAFDAAQPKQSLWTCNLDGVGLVGSPLLIGNVLIVVQQSGDVLRIDPKTGKLEQKTSIGQIATQGPFRLGNLLVVCTADGSLQHIESLVPEFAASSPEPAKPQPLPAEKPPTEKPAKDEKPEPNEKPKEGDSAEKPETPPKTDAPAPENKSDPPKTE